MTKRSLKLWLLLPALAAICCFGAMATQPNESRSEMQRQSQQMQQEITRTRREIGENDRKIKETMAQLEILKGEIERKRETIDSSGRAVGELTRKMQELQTEIAAGEKRLAELREHYLKCIKKMRAAKVSNSELAFIFSSENFAQGMRRLRYLREFAKWRSGQSEKIYSQIDALTEQRKSLDVTRSEKNRALQVQKTAQADLQRKEGEQRTLATELERHGQELRDYLARKQQEANNLQSRISAAIAAEEQARKAAAEKAAAEKAKAEKARAEKAAAEKAAADKAAAERAKAEKAAAEKARAEKAAAEKAKADKAAAEKAAAEKAAAEKQKNQNKEAKKEEKKKVEEKKAPEKKPEEKKKPDNKQDKKPEGKDYAEGGSFESMRGSLPRPVDGAFRIISPFGRHELPDLPGVMYDNPGIDAEVSAGASAKAVAEGKVTGIYSVPGYGTVVIVGHGNYYSVYGNLSSSAVKQGDAVKPGQKIGAIAKDPDNDKRTVFHFEIWKGREKLNPAEWIR